MMRPTAICPRLWLRQAQRKKNGMGASGKRAEAVTPRPSQIDQSGGASPCSAACAKPMAENNMTKPKTTMQSRMKAAILSPRPAIGRVGTVGVLGAWVICPLAAIFGDYSTCAAYGLASARLGWEG